MTDSLRCPKCGTPLPSDAPAGLCPECLIQAGFESQPPSHPALQPTVLTPPAPTTGFEPPTPEELGPLFPQLEILELLGKGGMGAVYKARQPGLDRLVAVKILPPEISRDPAFAERFQREARALARLSHPHIVTVYDFGQTDSARRGSPDPAAGLTDGLPSSNRPQETFGQPGGSVGDRPQRKLCYIVMEFVDGANLRQTIRAGKLAPAEALAIVPQICEALQFAHDEGIVHRDIKPENILIDKRGRVKIADFGLAKLLGTDASDHSLTATHQVMGTLRYMAPEQMQGSREVDHRADIYSLGVVFYELLTGELPMGKFAPPSKRVQVDVRIDEIVLRALEQEPEQRYQHASDVKTDVEIISCSPQPPSAVRPKSAKYAATESHHVQAPADCLLLAAGIAFVTACGMAIWLATTRGDSLTTSLVRVNLINASVIHATYSLLIGVAGLMLRQLRARLFVLMTVVVIGLFLPAVAALNVAMEFRNIPNWPVVIPLWLGMPAAVWVVVRLFRDDVRSAFESAAEQRRMARLESAKCIATPTQHSGEPGGVSPRTGDGQVRGLTPAGSPRPGERTETGPDPSPRIGLLAAVVCELRNVRQWVSGDTVSPTQALVFPGRLMTLLSLAGCLMLMVPWVDLHIGQDANVKQFWNDAELPDAFSRTLYGSDRWPGIVSGVAFSLLTLLLIMTPGRRPLSRKRAAVMSVIALGAVVSTLLVKPELETDAITIPIIRHVDARLVGQPDASSGSGQLVGKPRMERVTEKGSVRLRSIEYQATYREGFYGSLALSVVVLLFSAIGVRHAAVSDAEANPVSLPRSQTRGPAIALILYALFLLFPAVLCFTNGFDIADGNDGMPASVGFGMIVFSFLLLALVGLLIRGGWHMLALESHRAALLGNLLGQPVGLWGLFVLSRPEVKAAFASVSRKAAETFDRPKLVPVFATMNLLGAIVLMLVCAMEDSASVAESVPRIWQMWQKVDAVLGFTMAAGMFAASIGLFLWKPWARKLTLGVCVFGLASFVFDAPYLARFAIPDAYSEIQNMLIAEGVDPETRETIAMLTVVTLIGGVMLVGLTWLIGQLVYFTRPRVVVAFESSNERQRDGETPGIGAVSSHPSNGVGRISLWTAIAGLVIPALLAIGAQWVVATERHSVKIEFDTALCVVLGGLLELVALGCGIVARRTASGKAGLLIATISLLLGLLIAPTDRVSSGPFDAGPMETVARNAAAVPPLGTITSGIGAEFTVPAGQVAVFEVVTRRDGETVPVPPHCGYVMAPPDKPVAGTFRWSRKLEEDIADGRSRKWSLEILTAGGGRGYSEAILLPEELNAAVGARGLSLGLLEPNEEAVHWGTDVNDLPANGQIGLRVTVVAHGMKGSGSGNAHIDWKKTQSAQSTTRRKLPDDRP